MSFNNINYSNEIENINTKNNSNELENYMNELSKNYPKISRINHKDISSNNFNTFNDYLKEIIDKKIPYPDENEIPEIQIKDQVFYIYGRKMQLYEPFDDKKFNNCFDCKKGINKFFCDICQKNICDNCCENCENEYHLLIDLGYMENEINNYKYIIHNLIYRYFDEPKKKENNISDEIIKSNVNSKIIDSNEINNDSLENLKEDTNDILLIRNILEKNYANYYHYKNIIECYKYIKKNYILENQDKPKSQIIDFSEEEEFLTISIYKVELEKNIIQIFGDEFVKENKKKCHIKYRKKIYRLTGCIKLDNSLNAIDSKIYIELIGFKNVVDLSHMFNGCSDLESVFGLYKSNKYNINNIINLSHMFDGCSSLESIFGLYELNKNNTKNIINLSNMLDGCPSLEYFDLSKLNISNVKNMSFMFNGCSSLKSLPDISKWNTMNIEDISFMFNHCLSLKMIPDISKWNMKNVKNMTKIFSGCSSLKSLPDISKWNTEKVEDMSYMFYGCSSLESLPDISKWDVSNVKNMSRIFKGCSSLESLPDISKWDVSNVDSMSFVFDGCSSLKSLPDISNWNLSNVEYMNCIFNGCSSLKSLPDISKWNTKNIKSMSYMFYGCSSLKSLPDISKWNLNNVLDMRDMFYECPLLESIPDLSK